MFSNNLLSTSEYENIVIYVMQGDRIAIVITIHEPPCRNSNIPRTSSFKTGFGRSATLAPIVVMYYSAALSIPFEVDVLKTYRE